MHGLLSSCLIRRSSPGGCMCRKSAVLASGMRAVYAESINPNDPLTGLVVGERPEPEVPEGWATVQVRASSLNHHDLWSLRGVGLSAEQLPMILGCDAAGVDDE